MVATLEQEDTKKVDITIATDEGIAVRMNPEDMGKGKGPAVEVQRGEFVRVSRVMANMLIANKQAVLGRVELENSKKGKK